MKRKAFWQMAFWIATCLLLMGFCFAVCLVGLRLGIYNDPRNPLILSR